MRWLAWGIFTSPILRFVLRGDVMSQKLVDEREQINLASDLSVDIKRRLSGAYARGLRIEGAIFVLNAILTEEQFVAHGREKRGEKEIMERWQDCKTDDSQGG